MENIGEIEYLIDMFEKHKVDDINKEIISELQESIENSERALNV